MTMGRNEREGGAGRKTGYLDTVLPECIQIEVFDCLFTVIVLRRLLKQISFCSFHHMVFFCLIRKKTKLFSPQQM